MELISREEVLNILNDICNHALEVYDKKYHLPIRTITSTATEDIKRLPSRPKGKWIDKHATHYECSECGEWVNKKSAYRYCTFCGADMRGRE